MKIRLFVLPLISTGILFASLFILVFMMPFYLTYPGGFPVNHRDHYDCAVLFLLVISPISGMLADWLGSRMLCTAGMAFLCLSLFCLIFLTPESGVRNIVWRMALAGIGTALFVSPNNTSIMGAVPVRQRGIASGAIATARTWVWSLVWHWRERFFLRLCHFREKEWTGMFLKWPRHSWRDCGM